MINYRNIWIFYINNLFYFFMQEFRVRSQLARHLATGHGLVAAPGSPCPVMKTRAAFCLVTTPLTRVSRRICRKLLNLNRAARQPFIPINIALIKQECTSYFIQFELCIIMFCSFFHLFQLHDIYLIYWGSYFKKLKPITLQLSCYCIIYWLLGLLYCE